MTAAITLTGVRKRYDDFALHDIDLVLPAGQVMGLVGVLTARWFGFARGHQVERRLRALAEV